MQSESGNIHAYPIRAPVKDCQNAPQARNVCGVQAVSSAAFVQSFKPPVFDRRNHAQSVERRLTLVNTLAQLGIEPSNNETMNAQMAARKNFIV